MFFIMIMFMRSAAVEQQRNGGRPCEEPLALFSRAPWRNSRERHGRLVTVLKSFVQTRTVRLVNIGPGPAPTCCCLRGDKRTHIPPLSHRRVSRLLGVFSPYVVYFMEIVFFQSRLLFQSPATIAHVTLLPHWVSPRIRRISREFLPRPDTGLLDARGQTCAPESRCSLFGGVGARTGLVPLPLSQTAPTEPRFLGNRG